MQEQLERLRIQLAATASERDHLRATVNKLLALMDKYSPVCDDVAIGPIECMDTNGGPVPQDRPDIKAPEPLSKRDLFIQVLLEEDEE